MTDPIPAPDDDSAATRARIAALAEMRAIQLRLMEEERDAALLVFGLTSRERDRLKLELEASNNEYQKFGAELAKWKDLLNIAPEGAEGPADIARWIKELRAVAEAAKALAAAEKFHGEINDLNWDFDAATRARIAALSEAVIAKARRLDATLCRLGQIKEELDQVTAELEASTEEHQKRKAELAKWEDLLNIAPEGAEGPADIARWIKELRAVAEAAKALAAAEQWHYYSSGSMSWSLPAIEQQVRLKQAIAEAILALGPLWDWRAK